MTSVTGWRYRSRNRILIFSISILLRHVLIIRKRNAIPRSIKITSLLENPLGNRIDPVVSNTEAPISAGREPMRSLLTLLRKIQIRQMPRPKKCRNAYVKIEIAKNWIKALHPSSLSRFKFSELCVAYWAILLLGITYQPWIGKSWTLYTAVGAILISSTRHAGLILQRALKPFIFYAMR